MLSNRVVYILSFCLIGLLCLTWVGARAAATVIALNPAVTYQTMTGWETYLGSTVWDYKPYLPGFDRALDLAANDLGITRLMLTVHSGTEHPPGYAAQYLEGTINEGVLIRQYAYDIINDNADPFVADLSRFEFGLIDWRMENIVLPFKQKLEARGEKLYLYLSYVDFGESAFEHYQNPQEYAEFMLVLFDHLRTKYGIVPDGINIMNEPDLAGWSATTMGRLVAATGPRLAAAGYIPDFIGPSTTDRGNAVPMFDEMLAVPGAAQWMKYLSYHWYADTGSNSLQAIANRSVQTGVNVLMNEAWRSANDYEALHQDLKVGRVSAWQQDSFKEAQGFYQIDPNTFQVTIRDKTKFLRQYYKYIRPGAKRIGATTSNSVYDPLAFINSDGGYVTVIKAEFAGDFSVENLPAGTYGIFYTTDPARFDVQLPDAVVASGQALSTSIPAEGVITIYRKWPSSMSFSLASNANVSLGTMGVQRPLQVGYARVEGAAAGIALFGFRRNNVLVSEAGVPAVRPIASGRIYAETAGTVRTGLAIANPNTQDAVVSYYFTDAQGQNFGSGSTTIRANRQIAAFLDEVPFANAAMSPMQPPPASTFTFSSSVPVAAIALRQFVNERRESLMTTLPVADLSDASSSDTVVVPHYAEGGGWTTQVILLNPTDNNLSGNAVFFDPAGANVGTQGYGIPPRSAVVIRRSSSQTTSRTGSVQLVPDGGSSAPVGVSVVSFSNGSVTVTETGVLTLKPDTALNIYAEAGAGLLSAFAFANPQAQPIDIGFTLLGTDGRPMVSGTIPLPANGQKPLFADELPGAGTLPQTFRGMLRITAPAGARVAAIGLRSRYNERGDFLLSTTMPHQDSTSQTELFVPHFAQGGGYNTQFVLLSTPISAAANGLIRFLTQAGQPMTIPVQ